MKKAKHNPPGKPKTTFIQFSKVQQGFIGEIIRRQMGELGEALKQVYEELGIAERVSNSPPGTYMLRQDGSGVDVIPVIEIKAGKEE